MSDNIVYEASVYTRQITYRDLKGDIKTVELYFALDPLELMRTIASFQPKKIKSGNPALNGRVQPMNDEEQLSLIKELVVRAAGYPSDDGEVWEPFENFMDHVVGKAFITKLTSSDEDRKEFTQKVMLDPFKAFVGYAKEDPTNSQRDIQEFEDTLARIEKMFKGTPEPEETMEQKRARLAAEMAELEAQGNQSHE